MNKNQYLIPLLVAVMAMAGFTVSAEDQFESIQINQGIFRTGRFFWTISHYWICVC